MKKASRDKGPSAASLAEIPELEFAKLKRIPNKYAGKTFANIRVIDPDLEVAFPDSEAVNRALRAALVMGDALGMQKGLKRRRVRAA